MSYPKKLSPEFSGALRTFSFWVANGTLGYPLLEGVDYRSCLGDEPSMLEMAYAIFANVLELDEQGVPVNAKYAEHRAAQYIRQYCDPGYQARPAFEDWEQELYGPPDRDDSKPLASRRGLGFRRLDTSLGHYGFETTNPLIKDYECR